MKKNLELTGAKEGATSEDEQFDGVVDATCDRKLFTAFVRQMIEDSLIPDEVCNGSSTINSQNRHARDEAINFFFSTSKDVVNWRETIIQDYLGYEDAVSCVNMCRKIIKDKNIELWKKVKKEVKF